MKSPRSTSDPAVTKGETSGRYLLETALRLFRRKGFERTTMRDIAQAAGMSLGATYYHFRSKEDLVLAYYRFMQDEHERLLRERLPGVLDLQERVRIVLRSKLELVEGSLPFLGALFRFVGEPGHPLSVFGADTADVRTRSRRGFGLALEGTALPAAAAGLAENGLWFLHLALILHAIHDRSPGMARTYALADAAAAIVAGLAGLAGAPAAGPVVDWLVGALGAEGEKTP